ncbi:MAG: PFL family protein [bacterium]
MFFTTEEILETIRMVQIEHLDIRTVTLGLDLLDCRRDSVEETVSSISKRLKEATQNFLEVAKRVEIEYGIPIVNKRVAITPISLLITSKKIEDYLYLGKNLDKVGEEIGLDFIGGYTAFLEYEIDKNRLAFLKAIPPLLNETSRLCASIVVASTKSGINVDAIKEIAYIILDTAKIRNNPISCAKLIVMSNPPPDNPFMAGAFHGIGRGERILSVGISGPGTVRAAIERLSKEASLIDVAEEIKRVAFKITRAGEFIGKEISKRLGIRFGSVDISLAPTPEEGDSVGKIMEKIGVEVIGAPGSTGVLFLLNDAIKRGGLMASSSVGGLSGTFIPVSEDKGIAESVSRGALTLEKLEALTNVCSVGLDMVPIPGDIDPYVLMGIILDEMTIGVMANKTTAVRILPIPGGKPGEWVELGGLLGKAPIININSFSCKRIFERGGRIPPPINSFRN